MLLQYLLVFIVVLVIIIDKRRSKKFLNLHKELKVTYPYIPLLGHAYKFIGTNEDRMMVFDQLARQAYRNKYGIVSFWFANHLCVAISDPVSAGVVFKSCIDKWPFTIFARHLIGNGSVLAEEDIWRLRRKILLSAFIPRYTDKFIQVFEKNNAIMVEELAAVVGKGDFSLWNYFCSYTLDSALDMTLGENVNAQRHREHPFVRAFEEYFENITDRVCQPWLYSAAVYKLLPVRARQAHNRKVMWNFVENLILKKKAEIKEKTSQGKDNNEDAQNDTYKTFLELLIEHSGGESGYTDTELREEMLVLIIAATDTSAAASCFVTVLLANHPEWQDKVYEEIREVMGDSKRPITLHDLTRLKYLDAVIKESMRLYPPVPITLRTCKKDIELPSGLILYKGCIALMNLWGIHRNPHFWGADADEFNPERFLNATPEQLNLYMPFSYGPRNCAGTRIAYTSIKMSIVRLLRQYRLMPAKGYTYHKQKPLRVTYEVMLKHIHHFQIQLEYR